MDKSITIFYLDDDRIDLMVAENIIAQIPNLQLIGTSTDPIEALIIIKKQKPDIVFLDLLLPEYDGLELADLLKETKSHIVFLTGIEYYAIEAFKLFALDYLVKPITKNDIENVIHRFNNLKNNFGNAELIQIKELIKVRKTLMEKPTKMLVTSNNNMQVVELANINYVEHKNGVVHVYLNNWTDLKTEKPISKMIKYFERNVEFKILNNNLIINKSQIKALEKNEMAIKLTFLNNESFELLDLQNTEWLNDFMLN